MMPRNPLSRISLTLFYKRAYRPISVTAGLHLSLIKQKQGSCCNLSYQQRNYSLKAETHEFQAETKSLLDIVAKSLYSDQEVKYFITFYILIDKF